MKCYLNSKSIKLRINKNTRSVRAKKNVNSLIYNKITVPQIVNYYLGKKKVSNEETSMPIYFTDWYQIELGQNTYIEFNKYSFNNINYIGESELNCIFNN